MSLSTETSIGAQFERLIEILARLRAPGGCPWDREQTFDTIKPFLLEETYEVLDAIDKQDWKELSGELGDLLLQIVFFSQMAAERNLFTIGDAIGAITRKLIRRHPHVFGDETALTEGDVRKRWSEIKAEEKRENGRIETGLLDGVPRALPALVEAQQITSRAAQAGFDWRNSGEVLAKLDEERAEFECARDNEKEGELGDMLFVLVNLARFHKIDPEQALRRTNAKFRQRFGYVQSQLASRGKSPGESTIEEMESLWQETKA
ncbi:MAG: nucleoside triphosphate pyrophosphohydrolase [Acidobacteriota bacterium]|nr:nucleoside triphosphate pyrophosphohydrolase [Acidobacteriota bacterium]